MRKKIVIILMLLLPSITMAYCPYGYVGVGGVACEILNILDMAKNVIFALAFVAFFWGMLSWIFTSGEKKDKGKGVMLWAILALFIMFSIWGIIAILQNSFWGIRYENDARFIDIPTLPERY